MFGQALVGFDLKWTMRSMVFGSALGGCVEWREGLCSILGSTVWRRVSFCCLLGFERIEKEDAMVAVGAKTKRELRMVINGVGYDFSFLILHIPYW